MKNQTPNIIKEACVQSVAQAVKAEANGAAQLELCSRLDLDGLTPDVEVVLEVLQMVSIPVKVMIRPVAGGFDYDTDVLGIMKSEIRKMSDLGVYGVVYGVTDNNRLNFDAIKELIEVSRILDVTIHKAIDACNDPLIEVETLNALGRSLSVLSSGGASTATEGAAKLKEMIRIADPNIRIIAAGKITRQNFHEVHQQIGASAYHGRNIVSLLD